MNYLFFSDIDYTIYDHNQIVLNQTIEDLKKARSYKIEFILATGNGLTNNVFNLVKQLNARYAVLLNGALLYDFLAKKIIYEKKIAFKKSQKVFELAKKYKLSLQWWSYDNFYFASFADQSRVEYVRKFIQNSKITISNQVQDDVLKMELVGQSDQIDKILKAMKPLNLNATKMSSKRIEIVANGLSKASGLKQFVKMFKIPWQKVGAIGDSMNDLEMLQFVFNSYAVENADQAIKDNVKFIVNSVTNNGVGEALLDFISRVITINKPT